MTLVPPAVSVILSTYNGARTLPRALQSIAAQTFTDLEVIIIDDASTDTTSQLLQECQIAHPQLCLTVIRNSTNMGLTNSLMKGLAAARGTYVARIDADDWWAPEKIAKQVAYLRAHPRCSIVGSWYMNVRPSGKTIVRLPVDDRTIRQRIFWHNPFGHSCVLIRKNILEKADGYNTNLRYGQDRDLWFRLLPLGTMANLPEVLCYRTVDSAVSTTHVQAQMRQQVKTVHYYIQLYRASPLMYVGLLEPLLLLCVPLRVRRTVRVFYDYLFAH